MSRVIAVAGLGEEVATSSPRTMLLWGIIMGTTVGIFIGTLVLNPSKKRS